MVRYGAYEKHQKAGRKVCMDCPTRITFGKRCPICADIHAEKMSKVRGKARWQKVKAEREKEPRKVRLTGADLDCLRDGALQPTGVMKPSLKSGYDRHRLRMFKLIEGGFATQGDDGQFYITAAGREAVPNG